MGQKINPNGLRLGINKTWSSRWYAKSDYAKFLHEDIKIKNSEMRAIKKILPDPEYFCLPEALFKQNMH